MQQILQGKITAIDALRNSIAETIAEKYRLPFDGSSVQTDIYVALYYYWELKKKRISRTLQAIRAYGVVEAVNRLVSRDYDSYGFVTFSENDMYDKTFEHVVLKHPKAFSPEARIRAIGRLA